LVGCGGDRDREKRPLMGAVAQSRSDLLVVTSDNPRSEEPQAIIDEILSGVSAAGSPVLSEVDRREAIRLVLSEAEAGDIVLIAGKGHEDYQLLAGETVYFSDAEEVRAYFDQGS
jgi:UDP-N-acetylmuramoyl-L-alanyl-D-glutamate--2,6-diaminopimelate ligase